MKKLFTLHKILFFVLLFGCQFSKAQTLQVSSPNGGESWLGGSSHAITWTYANVDNIKIEYSLNNGLTWTIITSSYPASALSYTWTVPCIGSSLVKVRITNILQFTQDESNTTFTIPEPTVDITYPNGGESFGNGTGQYITWSTTGVTTLALQYTIDNGLTWTNIGNFPAVNTYCNWIAPATATNQVRVRGYNIESAIDRDSSASLFSVTTLPTINNDKYKGGSYDGYKMCSSLSDTIKVLTPNGGEVLNPTSNVNITWGFRNVDNVKIEYTTDNGLTWNLIATNIPVDVQKYTWTVPNIPSTQCLIKITALDRPLYDISDAVFTINSAYVNLLYPNGGESFGTSTGQYIEWDYNSVTTVKLEYSTNNGNAWTSIGTAPAANKYANWIPPATIGNQYLLRVSDNSVPSLLDISDANFSVVSVPTINNDKYKGGSYDGYSMANSYADSIKVTSPNGGELWTSASTRNITWTYNNVDNISIEYSLDDGITWNLLVNNIPASQLSYNWTIPTTPSNTCRIRIKDISRNLQDISDAAFIIPTAYVQITYPNGGERFGGGTGQYIEWNYADLQTIKLEYSTDNGVNWLTIGTAPAVNKYANWVVPTNVSTQILIRATDISNPVYTDKSNTTFSSYAIPTINLDKYKGGSFDGYSMYSFFDSYVQIKKPNGGEIWGNGTTQQIKWAKLNNNENIILDYTTDNEATWTTLLNNVPDTPNVYNWTINAPVSNICKVRARTVTGTLLDKSDDFFTIANPNGIVTNPITGTTFCSGANATVNFSLNTTFNTGNRFIVQLSDSVGTFNGSVINIGEVTATTPQAISVTFPARYYSSNLYRLRVIGTNPPTIGTDNGTNFTINPLPYVNLGNDTTLCTGTSITLNATNSSSTYLWSTGATTPTISVSNAGTYRVAVTNSCGTSRDTIIVTGVTQPSVNLGVDTSICINSSLTLNAGTNAIGYLWSTGSSSQTINLVTPGTYSVAVSNICGTKRDTILITNKSTFTVDLGADRAICSGQSITLNAGNAGLSYLWSTGQTTQTISVTQPGIYWVNVSDVCQTISDQINIINGAFNVSISGTLSVCNGSSTTLTATGGNSYAWNTGSSSSSITVAPIVNTTYSVTATNYYGCTSSAQATVTVNNLFTNLFNQDTIKVCGTTYPLNAGSGYSSYLWNTGATTQTINATSAGWFKCTVSNGTCSGTDSVYCAFLNTGIINNDTTICSQSSLTINTYSPSANYQIGQSFGGGKIFYLNPDGRSGLIAAINDIGASGWLCNPGVSGLTTNDGLYNTNSIVAGCSENGAARLCYNLILNGYDDWFLPARDQLNLLYQQANSIGNFSGGYYWSSTDFTGNYAWAQTLPTGNQNYFGKTEPFAIRPIRSFSNAPALSSYGFLWSTGQNTSSIVINPTTSSKYYCTFSDVITSCTDSVTITVKQPTTSNTNSSVCSNQLPYVWNGISCNSAGNYNKSFVNAAGCDSVANLNLTIKLTTSSITTVSVCNNQLPYVWNGTAYNSFGTYNKTLVNAVGCDSIATLNLTVKTPSTSTTNSSVCSNQLPYTWNGVAYSAAGTYNKTFVNAAGCDSIATLNLTVKPTSTSTTNTTACGSYVWNGVTYTTSGTYTKMTTNTSGCDSTATLNLTLTTANNTAPSAITGARNINRCDTLQNYSVLPMTGVTFTWTVTGTGNSVKTGQGTNAVVLVMKVAGTISVKATNTCGTVSTATTLAVTKATPATPGTISKSFVPTTVAAITNACLFTQSAFATAGVADTFRIRAVANATGYIWKAPTGSTVTRVNDTTIAVVFANIITVPDSIKVYSLSACDTSLVRGLALVKTTAAAPGSILKTDGVTVAATDVCPNVGGSVTYKVRKVATAISYNWYMTRGTKATITHINPLGVNDTAIIVNYQTGFTVDSINVSCSNGCGTSAVKLLRVSAILPPPTPSKITASTGNFYPCRTNIVQYTATSPAATTAQSPSVVYRWTRPANTTITASNADSSVITIRFESTYSGGSLSVKCQTACGIQGVAKSQTLYYTPPTPTGINSGSGYNVCIGSSVSLTCVDPSSSSEYGTTQTPITMHRWTRPNFTSITSATADSGTISLLIQTGFTGGNVTAKCQSPCGTTGSAKSQALTLTACPSGTKNSNVNNGVIGSFDVNIFPNPTKNAFNLQVSSTSRETFSVKVMDVQGRLIKTMKVLASEINRLGSELKSGVYMLEVREGDNVKTVRVVKY